MAGVDDAGPAQAEHAEEDFRRELAARRRDLERESSDKARELKAQHQRRMDALRQEQLDWEEHKRHQTKELADRAEKLRAGEERLHKDTHRTVTAKDEAGVLRKKLDALEQERVSERTAHATAEHRIAAAQAATRKARRAARWLALVSILGPVAWLVAGGRDAGLLPSVVAGVFLAVAVVLAATRVDLKD